MNKVSRRALARYAADQLLAGKHANEVAKHLVAYLVDAGQTGNPDFLLGDINWELEQRQALTVGKVTSASPLSKELESALKAQLKKATKSSEVLLEKTIDKSVLGGLRIETSGRVWDSTVSRKLADLREVF